VQLKVTDNTALSFPSSHLGDLSSTASTQVVVKASCTCVSDLKAIAKSKQIQLTWTNTYADHYNVYRGTVKGGPYPTLIKTIAGGSMTRLGFIDTGLTNNVTYYYVVKDANAQGVEYCVSNEASGKPVSLF
jgi:fibronectin type 3 domain-containing protein